MTVSTMRCCRRLAEALLVCLFFLAPARAGEIGVRDWQLAAADDGGYTLSADFDLDFGQRLEEAVGKGLALYFVAEFQLTRPRWYWFDEKVATASQTWRLTYHALTRQYRLSTGVLHQSFPSLADAVQVLAHLRRWSVVEPERLQPGDRLDAALRLYLDVSQLPKPFQVEALSNKDWLLSSDWKRWTFVVPPAATGSEGK